jgi:hypothetical protein
MFTTVLNQLELWKFHSMKIFYEIPELTSRDSILEIYLW